MLWSNVIDVIRGSLFVLAHWCGGSLGAAILLGSMATRIALLPITLPAERRRLAKLRDPKAPAPSPLAGLLQFPPAMALYAAIRSATATVGRTGFLWIRDLSSPDKGLAVIAALVTAALTVATTSRPNPTSIAQHLIPAVIGAAVTLLILVHIPSSLALYSIANSLIGALERVLAARTLGPLDTKSRA